MAKSTKAIDHACQSLDANPRQASAELASAKPTDCSLNPFIFLYLVSGYLLLSDDSRRFSAASCCCESAISCCHSTNPAGEVSSARYI